MKPSSLFSALRRRIPNILLGLLLLIHIALAARTHINNAFIPGDIQHQGFHLVVSICRILQGYEYTEGTNSLAALANFTSPPKALPWSEPHFLWQELSQGRLALLWRNSDKLSYWTDWPHSSLLPALVYFISGGSVLATALAPQLYVAILLLSVFGIGRQALGKWYGLAAAVIASGYFGIIAVGRTHHDSLLVAALSTAVVYLLLKSKGFTRIGPSALAGLVVFLLSRSGETISMTALGGLICFGPFLWALWCSPIWRRPKITSRPTYGLLLFLGQIIAILWLDGQRLSHFFINNVPKSMTNTESFAMVDPSISNPMAWILPYLSYLVELAVNLVQPLMALWLLLGAALLWRAPAGLRLVLVLMVMIPLLPLTLLPKKANWYLIPLLPGMALITAYGLAGLKSIRARTVTLCLASLCGMFMLVGSSLAPALTNRILDLGGITSVVRKAVWIPYLNYLNVGPPTFKATVTQFIRHHEATGLEGRTSNLVAVLTLNGSGERFRYPVELKHPELRLIIPNIQSPPLTGIPGQRFRYLLFFDELGRLSPMPKSEREFEKYYRINHKMVLPFITGLRKLKWNRVDLSSGPIYQQDLSPRALPQADPISLD